MRLEIAENTDRDILIVLQSVARISRIYCLPCMIRNL